MSTTNVLITSKVFVRYSVKNKFNGKKIKIKILKYCNTQKTIKN